jgi:hypothetical protein
MTLHKRNGMNIMTEYWKKPIPDRSHDWCAIIDGQEEAGPQGWGHTEDEAIRDLLDRIDEENDGERWAYETGAVP